MVGGNVGNIDGLAVGVCVGGNVGEMVGMDVVDPMLTISPTGRGGGPDLLTLLLLSLLLLLLSGSTIP